MRLFWIRQRSPAVLVMACTVPSKRLRSTTTSLANRAKTPNASGFRLVFETPRPSNTKPRIRLPLAGLTPWAPGRKKPTRKAVAMVGLVSQPMMRGRPRPSSVTGLVNVAPQ